MDYCAGLTLIVICQFIVQQVPSDVVAMGNCRALFAMA
jgi:hypothetical protein